MPARVEAKCLAEDAAAFMLISSTSSKLTEQRRCDTRKIRPQVTSHFSVNRFRDPRTRCSALRGRTHRVHHRARRRERVAAEVESGHLFDHRQQVGIDEMFRRHGVARLTVWKRAEITQLAVFEAVNAMTSDYEPYIGTVVARAGASAGAVAIVVATADPPTAAFFLNPTPGSSREFVQPNITINLGDLNTATPEGARIAYGRIQSASRAVCGASSPWVPGGKWAWKRCYEATVNRAVAQVNRPAVAALHRNRSKPRSADGFYQAALLPIWSV